MPEQDLKAAWLFKFSATVVVGIAFAAYYRRRSKASRLEKNSLHGIGNGENSNLTCFCGLPAKLRISRSSKDPFRLFYNCPKSVHYHQCEFFHWADEITGGNVERHLEEKAFLRNECLRLQQRIDHMQSRRRQERQTWDREKAELRSRLYVAETELDDIKKKIEEVNESEEMPPFDDDMFNVDDGQDEDDGVLILEAL